MNSSSIDLSVIIPVCERPDDIRELFAAYKESVAATGLTHEVIFVLDGRFSQIMEDLEEMRKLDEDIKVIQLAQSFGEAAALSVAFEYARGETFLTLPAYFQAEPGDIPKLLEDIGRYDMVIGRRWPRKDSKIKQLQTSIFHGILGFIADSSFRDLGCGLRAFRRQVVEEIPVYGDQHRFLPVLAAKRGFRIKEVDVAQSDLDKAPDVYKPGIYLRRVLDILTVFFLVKFTKKPLRFFGLIGSTVVGLGGLALIVIIIQRLFFGIGLADRPALLLSSLLVVLGVQLFALGLIGELIIFVHAREIKEYTIEQILD